MTQGSEWPWVRWFLVAGLFIVVGGTAAVVFTVTAPDRYESSLTYILAGTTGLDDNESAGRTVEALLTADSTAEAVIESSGVPLSFEEFSDGLEVARPPASAVLEVTFTDEDPILAQRVIRALDPAFQAQLAELGETSADTSSLYSVVLWSQPKDEATLVQRPIVINAMIGVILGGMVAVAVLSVAWGVRVRRRVSPIGPPAPSGDSAN